MLHYKKDKVIGIEGKLSKKLNLLISGFSKQNIITVEKIFDAINALPDAHITGLNIIEYDPKRLNVIQAFFNKLGYKRAPKCCKGVFIQNKRKIVIYEFNTREMLYHILYHEVGHFVYQLVLDSKLKKHWVSETHHTAPFITPLSRRNACEDFAECYTYYITKCETLMQSKQKYDFMHEYVFGNTRDNNKKSVFYFDGLMIDRTY